ncbi:MAG TPA: ISKra4 family transposase [Acetobacteraceae bacterium]|nr:ISKra4 family transposase [Acetobacteraceae bacterium]
MDDSTRRAVLDAVQQEAIALLEWLGTTEGLDLAAAEQRVRTGIGAIGTRLLEAGLAARGSGKTGARIDCACGGTACFEGYRPKGVQTLIGWVTVRRAYYACPHCGHGGCPLDAALGLARDSHSPGVRGLAARFGALLPFGPAAATLAAAAGVQLSANTVRRVTETLGARREAQVIGEVAHAWTAGLAPAAGSPPDRLYVAMDGVRILGMDGAGREVKVGVIVPVARTPVGERRAAASYAASFEPAEAFGRRLALEAHRRGLEDATDIAVLGDGAAWIWNLAAEHFPAAVQIVDWFHASERIWELGRALFGTETPETTAWVEPQLGRLATGQAAALAADWRALPLRGEAAAVRDEQATYFTNQAERMAYDRYRAAGWDIGSGMVESACKYVIGAREKGPGMRWSEAGANAVAQLRVLLCNDQWDAVRAA